MTLGVTVCEITVQGNGVTTTFTYPFPIPSPADAILTLTDSTGAQTVVGPTQYVLTGTGSATGGTFTYPVLGSPIASGNFLTLERILPIVQTTTVANQGPTFASIESEFDYLTMIDQQLQQQVSRAYTANFIDINPVTQLPPAAQRANFVFGFDASGNPLMYSPTGAAATNALNVTYLPGGAGAIATNVQSKLREFPSVKDFGARADGVTNDGPAFIAAAAAESGFWVPEGTYLIGSNVTIPNGVTMEFESGAVLNTSGGVVFICHGLLNAPRNVQIFTGTGNVIGMRTVYPEWWGAEPNNTGFDSQPALQAAHTALKASGSSDGGRPTCYLGAGVYYVGSTWTIQPTANNQIEIAGDGTIFGGSRIQPLASFSALPVVYIEGSSDPIQQIADWYLHDFAIIGGTGSATIGLQVGTTTDTVTRLIGLQNSKIENVNVSNFPVGMQFCHVRLVDIDRCSVWNKDLATANTCISIFEGGWFTGDLNFNDSQVVNNNAGAGMQGVYISSDTPGSSGVSSHVAGIRFNNFIGYSCDQYLTISCNGGSMIGDIWVNPGCQFDAPTIHGIFVQCDGAGSFIRDIHITGAFINSSTATGDTINLIASNSGSLLDVWVSGNWIWLSEGRSIIVSAVTGGAIRGVHICDNAIADNLNNSGAAILIDGNTSGAVVSGNNASSITAATFKWLIELGAGTDYFVVTSNNSNGLANTAVIENLSGGTHTAVANNI